jgi:hypothetical protein
MKSDRLHFFKTHLKHSENSSSQRLHLDSNMLETHIANVKERITQRKPC